MPPTIEPWSAIRLLSRLAGVLNHDFCPGANRWVYWLKHPSVPLITASAAATLCGVAVNPAAFVLAVALGAVLLLGGVWPWLSVCGVRCSLEFENRRGAEGCPTTVRLKIINRAPWPIWGLTLDRGFRRFGGECAAWALARVNGLSTSEFRFEFTPDARGEYPCEPVRLRTAFPFGLWYAARNVPVAGPILIWPRIVPLDTIPDSADLRESQDRLSPRRVGETGDLMGTRQYRLGDSLRRVHWAQTARTGRMIVCERQAAVQSAVRLEIDLDPAVHSPAGADGTLEWTIRAAASIAQVLSDQHSHVECLLGGEMLVWGEGEAARRRFFDRLARIPLEGVHPSKPQRSQNPGELLRIVCTTPLGATLRGAASRSGVRWVLIETAGAANPGGPAPRGAIRLAVSPAAPADPDPQTQLRQQWSRSCHGSPC